jgi:hypothetical protein
MRTTVSSPAVSNATLNGSGTILVQPSRVRRSYRKETKAVARMSEIPTPSLTKTDSTVHILLKTWDFLVPGDSELHQKRARTI